ncbi:MAG TPA: hypothetical protein VEH47_09215 [Candidatus Acidoferrales bacterium]|nr:hypothetical protein [Candidatus Acidoferrales bacterium]
MSVAPSNKAFFLRPPLGALIICGVIAFGSATVVSAQETPTPPLQTQPSPSPAAQPPPGQAPTTALVPPKPVALYNLLQKKSIVFPDIAYSTERLSAGQKLRLSVDNSVSVDAGVWAALGSGVGQADDHPAGYGQGWGGYGKRFGANLARESSNEFFGTFLLASRLHEDPRFYSEIHPKFFHAVKYSLQHVFVMQNDDGRQVVAWSRLGGPLMAEGLANVYWPDQNRTAGATLFRYGLDLASRWSGNLLRDYWPVFLAKISHAPRPDAGGN